MVTIRNIDETFRFYGSFGAKQMDVENGTCFTFPDKNSYIRFWGDLHGFCVAAVDFTPPEDVIFRSQIHQRYLGIGFHEEGHYVSYIRKSDARYSTSGISCFVFHSPAPHFLKLTGGQRLRFHGMYFQEQFFQESNVHLYGSFWEDAKRSICSGEIHSPELTAIYQRIERCPLTGEPFQIWMRGQGLAATGFLLDLVHKYSTTQPVYLSEAELAAVSESKQFIRSNLSNMPSVLELCKRVAMNKNKLQKAFRLTEGKSIGEYVRTLRMEQALELLEESDMSVREIAMAIGYHGVSNFYHAFQQRFGSTPQAVRDMLKK